MKKSEIATIIFVVSLSMVITFFIAKAVIGDSSKLEEKVKHANAIPSSVEEIMLNNQFFNKNAINPTVEVYVGGSSGGDSLTNAQSQNNTTDTTQNDTQQQQ